MVSILRKLARLGGPVSAIILNILYFFLDGCYFGATEKCKICGFPIKRPNGKNTIWADAEVLTLVKRNCYIYPICTHCRKTESWTEIVKAYREYWDELCEWTLNVGFYWQDIELALVRDRNRIILPKEIKLWKKTIKRAYNSCLLGESEFCSFKKGSEIKEVIIAAERLSKKIKGISIVETPERISIRFTRYVKKEEIIYLPG